MKSANTSIGRRAAGAAATAFLAVGLIMTAGPAHADPDAVKAAQAKLAKLQEEGSALELQFIKLDSQLTEADAQVARLNNDLAAQQAKVDSMKGVVTRIALTQYQQSGLNSAAQVLAAPDDSSFLQQLATLDSVGRTSQQRVQAYQAGQAKVATTRASLVTKRNEVAAAKAQQATLVSQHQAKEAEQKALLDKLTKEEQQRLARLQQEEAARRAAEARAAEARAAAASRSTERPAAQPSTSPSRSTSTPRSTSSSSSSSSPSTSRTTTPAPAPVPASGRGGVAVQAALSKVGSRYVMGGTGPSIFDCSGLTSWAWRQAGVSITRTSQSQFRDGVPVSAANLQPGDLVFYYSGISHVGMYIGNGKIVHAANPRSGVNVTSLYSMPFMGARRVG